MLCQIYVRVPLLFMHSWLKTRVQTTLLYHCKKFFSLGKLKI